MTREYEVRPYRPGDEEGIVQLLQLAFDGWPKIDLKCTPLDHWKWKYLANPYKKNDISVAVNSNEIIGCKHSIPLNIKVESDVFFCNYGSDLAVHPNFRGLGVSKKIRELNMELKKKCGYQFAYFVTSNPIMSKSFSDNPRFPHKILNLVRIQDIDKQLRIMPLKNPWLMKLGFHASRIFNDLGYIFTDNNYEYHNDIREIGSFDSRIDVFWSRIAEQYDIIVERRRDYLNWRYCDPRGGDFIVKQIEEGRKVLGYSVLYINRFRQEYPVGYIVDMLTLPERHDAANALVADAIRYFDEKNINIVNYLTVKCHPYERILYRQGFLNSRLKVHVFFGRSMLSEYAHVFTKINESSASRAYFSFGDIDSLPSRMPRNIL